jgi:hypothetical protein
MLNGLYKLEFETAQASGSGVAVARDGRMFGGNSAFALTGSYREARGEIQAELSVLRHDDDVTLERVFGADEFTAPLQGKRQGRSHRTCR